MSGNLPTGTVTFLLTDIVGSTRLWEEAPGDTDCAVDRHVELIATAVADFGGHLLKPRCEGDSTFSVFARARDGVAAAFAAQQALHHEPWPPGAPLSVRIALHTGEAVERDGDYFGPVVNRAARLRSVATGGQVVLSATSAALVLEALPPGSTLSAAGEVALRDLDRPELVYVLEPTGGDPDLGCVVRLLGPVEVEVDGRPSDLRGPKERAVLALLATAAGPVSQDRLIDQLWGSEPPPSARKTLQTYVWRLRRTLGDGRLRTVPGGYLLEGVEVDLAAFERDLLHAEVASATSEPSAALAAFERVLGHWRGDAFTGCTPVDALGGEAERLAELRMRAAEGRVNCLFDVGRHAEAVTALEGLVRASPLREQLWRLLVLALYGCGRQGEALRAYQRARVLLLEELGVEPGPALRDAEQIVLHQRPTTVVGMGEPSGPSTGEVAGRIPSSLRSELTPLVGREGAQRQVTELLASHRLVTLTGAGGSGKTALAGAVAAPEDGLEVAWCELAGVGTTASPLHALARATGVAVPGYGVDDRTEDVLTQLVDRRLLLVLDNCEHILDAVAGLVAALLARCPGIRVLATSRAPLGVSGEQLFPVPPLRVPADDSDLTADALTLFVRRAVEAQPHFALVDEALTASVEICRRLDGVPLALEMAAARMSHLAPPELLARLDRRLDLLGARGSGPADRNRTLAATLDWSHNLLGADQQALFRRLAVFNGRFTLADVEACCGTDLDALPLLGALVDASLVVAEPGPLRTTYRLLETVRLYARGRLAGTDDESSTRDAHVRWCRDRLDAIPWDQRLLSSTAAERLEEDLEDSLAALRWAELQGDGGAVASLVASLGGALAIRGHVAESDRWFPVAIGVETSLPPGERLATVVWSLVLVQRWGGDLDDLALHRRRLTAVVEDMPTDHPVAAVGYATLASVCSRLPGERQAMEDYADRALAIAPGGAIRIRAMATCQKARSLLLRGEHQAAIALLDAAVEEATEDAVYSVHEDLALAHHLAGDHARAQAIAESRLGRGHPLFGRVTAILASVAAAANGDDDAAAAHLDRARRTLPVTAGSPLAANDCRLAEGVIASIRGDRDRAARLLHGLRRSSVSTNALGALLEHHVRSLTQGGLGVIGGGVDLVIEESVRPVTPSSA